MYTPKNRFELLDQLIRSRETLDVNKIEAELRKLDYDSLFQLWDANKIALVDQNLLTKDDPLVKANSRNAKTIKGKGISVCRELVYIGEICNRLTNMKTLDHDKLFSQYGEKLQYSNKNCGAFSKVSLNLGSEEDSQGNLDMAGLEDRIANKVAFRLAEILDERLKPFQSLAERLLGVETNLHLLTNSLKLTRAQMDQKISEKIKSPDLSKISAAQKEMDKELEKLEKLRQSFEKDLREAAVPPRRPKSVPVTHAAPPTTDRFQVWGRGADTSGAPSIPRVFNFVVSKIPNRTEYSTNWLKDAEQRIFREIGLQATIIEVEQMKASFTGARTKSFKFVVMTEDIDVSLHNFMNPKAWVSGVSISRYRRPKNQQPAAPDANQDH